MAHFLGQDSHVVVLSETLGRREERLVLVGVDVLTDRVLEKVVVEKKRDLPSRCCYGGGRRRRGERARLL